MNFEQMEYIVNVANEMSISKAAEKLFISTSGMSQSITQLENELGIKIFNRSKQGVTPTFEGKIVISKAMSLLNTIKELNTEILEHKNSNQTHLKILNAPCFTFILQETMVKFNSENKDITFELIEQNPTEIMQNFNKENYDFALIPASLEEVKKEKNIRFEHIHTGHICIAVGKKSPFYHLDYVTLSELKDSKLLMYNSSDYKKVLKLTKLNLNQVLVRSNSSSLIYKQVKESQAILFLHDFSIKKSLMVMNGDVKIIPIKEEKHFPVDFWLIYLETKNLTKVAKEFMDAFLDNF
ncbi:LysR family transcriptional regulator [Bacillus sp. RG28]|uniref:LysR family transcriptional regulator n=1 Tax=Gottfriedia endophytica TaxID=2820819 RepID=A0A940NMB2_9BACI|nr:LysR family transcriptional regulator [Gottfriedia endophytica]MBP0727090.1 LysR family transcriptional regulator [Gottfriedia endophytica]